MISRSEGELPNSGLPSQEGSDNDEEEREREEEDEENTDYLTDSNKENETDEENTVRLHLCLSPVMS